VANERVQKLLWQHLSGLPTAAGESDRRTETANVTEHDQPPPPLAAPCGPPLQLWISQG
jgi:hypothetical protein